MVKMGPFSSSLHLLVWPNIWLSQGPQRARFLPPHLLGWGRRSLNLKLHWPHWSPLREMRWAWEKPRRDRTLKSRHTNNNSQLSFLRVAGLDVDA